jgi:hypothetical protein
MTAVYVSPSSSPPLFKTGTHPDQVGVNDSPANCHGFPAGTTFRNPASANLYVLTTPQNTNGLNIYTHVRETDVNYSGGSPRSYKGPILAVCDVDNNDPAYIGTNIVGVGVFSDVRVGLNSQSYGTVLGVSSVVDVRNQPSGVTNEYCNWFGWMNAGTTASPLVAGGNWWFTDWAVQGPINQPGILNGISLVTNNFYNGSPNSGAAAGISLRSIAYGGAANNYKTGSTSYPWDIGYHVSGATSGGTGDGYTNAIQVGGTVGVWVGSASYGGDQGQVARGVVVKAKNAGTSVSRLGAFVSEGTGEGGGLVFGLDTNDADRVSISRPASGVMTLRGKVSFANGGYASSTTATPSNVTGKVALYNDAGTLIGYIPVYGSL